MAILRKTVRSPRPPQEYDPAIAARDAARIASYYTLKNKPLDIEGLISALGLRISQVPLAENISGFLKKELDFWTIGVNSLHHPNRQRFTLAHELGHYFLHRHRGDFEDGPLFRRDNQFNPIEREANQFAALLLMPENEFRQAMAGGELPDVAKSFGVSQQAAEYRRESIERDLGID